MSEKADPTLPADILAALEKHGGWRNVLNILESRSPVEGAVADGKCAKCGAPTDPDYGHVGHCPPVAVPVVDEEAIRCFFVAYLGRVPPEDDHRWKLAHTALLAAFALSTATKESR
jgi:hypothetical protein